MHVPIRWRNRLHHGARGEHGVSERFRRSVTSVNSVVKRTRSADNLLRLKMLRATPLIAIFYQGDFFSLPCFQYFTDHTGRGEDKWIAASD